MIFQNRQSDIWLALVLTAIGAALSWLLASGLPLIGIDDAAITRSYAENIADGVGYVYNVGGERVEGSTAFLWVSMLTGLYALTDTPEVLIIILSFAFTTFAVFGTLRLTRLLAELIDVDDAWAITAMAAFLLASPGYFMWTVWTMMELALWSMLLILLVLSLTRSVEDEESEQGIWIVLIAFLLTLTRPEGIVMALVLVIIALIIAPWRWRIMTAGILSALASFIAVTMFRLSYFGQPFPNTFYAKVSSDRLQGMKDGAKYLIDYVLNAPFAEFFLLALVIGTVWGLIHVFRQTAGSKGIVLLAAACFSILLAYAALGGDHFVLWRFYQPISPLMPVTAALGVAALLTYLDRETHQGYSIIGVAGLAVIMTVGSMHYRQVRFDVRKEYTLVQQGLAFGTYLNEADPRPIIGTGPAGGIALAYDGKILDLLGLNWTVMAHANPVKIGMRNHASFDNATFWKYAPDVVSAFNRQCKSGTTLSFWASDDAAFRGLYGDEDFRAAYLPVLFTEGDDCWPGFATPDWANRVQLDGMIVLDWNNVTTLQ